MYNKFQEKHGKTSEFTEIETWVLVINRIEGLPKVDAETNEEGIKENLDVIEYLYYYYVKEEAEYERPEILDDNDAEDEDAEGSSLVKQKTYKSNFVDLEKKFDRVKLAKELEEEALKLEQEELKKKLTA